MKRFIKKAGDFFYPNLSAWLLGLSALLAVLMCYLPVPAFVFGLEGSGTTSTECSCSVIGKCNDWSTTNLDEDCPAPWQRCDADTGETIICDGKNKKLPETSLTYQVKEQKCNKAEDPNTYNDYSWTRQLQLETNDIATCNKKVAFKPYVILDFIGFSDGNVDKLNSSGSIIIDSRVYAALYACDKHGEQDTPITNPNSTAGWFYMSHIFEKDTYWKFTTGTDPCVEKFNINTECSCEDENKKRDSGNKSIKEKIEFSAKVVHNKGDGVCLGKVADALLVFGTLKDTTTCAKAN